MKPILIVTQYFPPEIGAASNRISQLANGLQNEGFEVTVLTPLPNYPTGKIFEGYQHNNASQINETGVKIYRLWIYPSNSKNKFVRLFSMLSYSLSLIWFFIKNEIPDKVIIQSPPLIVAFTSVLFLKRKERKVILNVSDLWPLAGLKLNAFKRNFSYTILEKIERFNYKKADLVLGQSNEIITHVKSIVPEKPCFLYRNFPEFNATEINEIESAKSGKIKLVYAGLLGVAQGVLELCKHIDTTNVEFHIYGSGHEATAIQTYLKTSKEKDITYHGNLSRNNLHQVLISYDLTIVPLLTRIYGSVPSKIFEYAKLGLPILYFGGGEGEDLVKKYSLGWVAEAGNYKALNTVISKLKPDQLTDNYKAEIRKTALENFSFDAQIDNLLPFL